MKKSELQPSMPSAKLWLHISLFVIALFLLFTLLRGNLIDNERTISILVSLMVTLFIISLIELIPELVRLISKRQKQGKFRRFFGESVFREPVRLVFAHRRLNSNLSQNPFITHYKPPQMQGQPIPEGVNAWLAVQDVRAAVYLANEIYGMTGRGVKFIHDKDIEDDDYEYCAISIGLGFNGFTNHLAGLCDDCLFQIEFGQSLKSGFQGVTDYFKIKNEAPNPPDKKDDCIIARIVSRTTSDQSNQISFICAGRTAPGTAAAGYFLAKKWMELMKLYDDSEKDLDKDSLVVVVRHNSDDKAGTQEYDKTGDIVKEHTDWAKVSGSNQ